MIKDKQYWDTKHPVIEQRYSGRPMPGTSDRIDYDVRHFIWADDIILKDIIRSEHLQYPTINETALACQIFVVDYLKYVSDSSLGSSEYWLFPTETLKRRQGDCEDGANLIASLILNAIPTSEYWRVRVSAGVVQQSPTSPTGGHAYCNLVREDDNEVVILDWCLLEDSKFPVSEKSLARDVDMYKNVWFSYNHLFAWSHINFEMDGRVNDY